MLLLLPKRLRVASKWIIGLLLALIFILHGLNVLDLTLIKKLEGISSDLRLKATLPFGIDDRIVIADIDEASLTEFGQWPWNRNILAQLVDILFEHYQVRTLGFDMVFAEAAGKDMQYVWQSIGKRTDIDNSIKTILSREANQDQIFSQSLRNRSISSGIFFLQNSNSQLNSLPKPLTQVDNETHQALFLPKPLGYTANQSILENNTVSSGFFDNPTVDDDGVFRRVPLLQSYQGAIYPSLALAVAHLALDQPVIDIQLAQQDQWLAITAVQLGNRLIPTDQSGAVTIPFRGPEGSYPYISVKNILQKNISHELLQNKIILLGTSAPGLLDLRSTPVDESMPGVEVHANIIAGILDEKIPHIPSFTLGAMFILYCLLGLLLIVLPHFLSAFNTLLLCSALSFAWISLNFYLWNNGLIFPIAAPVLMILVFFIFHTFWGFFVESRQKRAIKQLFGQYIPPELVDEMSAQPETVSIAGQSKHLTVLFSDVRNFTSISESLDPPTLSNLMNDILTPLTHTIYQHRGTVDKYMGDAVMAFWGAPVAEPRHAHHAVLCALEMQTAITKVSNQLQEKGLPFIGMGIGINTGDMSVGNMGSQYRMAYTVLGDAVNLGSRLEGLSKAYGADIIVSEATMLEAPEFLYLPLDKVQVKGKEEPISIYQPLNTKQRATQAQLLMVEHMKSLMSAYIKQNWEEAQSHLNKLKDLEKVQLNTLISIYQQRLNAFKIEPPDIDWDGVFRHTSK